MKYITKRNRAALTIKAKHLAEESRIIRHEERKWSGNDKLFFSEHRKITVRNEARATQLAIAMMTGKPYEAVERKFHDGYKLNWTIVPRVAKMVEKYYTPSEEISSEELKESVTHPFEYAYKRRYLRRNNEEYTKEFFVTAVRKWIKGEDPFQQ